LKVHPSYYGVWASTIEIFGVSSDPIIIKTEFPKMVKIQIIEQPEGIKGEVSWENSREKCEKTGNFLRLVNNYYGNSMFQGFKNAS
jgi:hypothetical protein